MKRSLGPRVLSASLGARPTALLPNGANVDPAVEKITFWLHGGESTVVIAASMLLAVSFLTFNSLRVLLYLPQLLTCWRDRQGCPTINLLTWSSWLAANLSTALYMWVFLNDGWGLLLNLGNALMCLATIVVTLIKRRNPMLAPSIRQLS